MAYRDFAVAASEAKREPVGFSLGGEQFDCLPIGSTPITAALLEFAVGASTFTGAKQLIRATLKPGGEEQFDKTLARKHEPVDEEVVMAVALWLIEVYTGRPILRSDDSPSGSSTAGSSSTDFSPAPEDGS